MSLRERISAEIAEARRLVAKSSVGRALAKRQPFNLQDGLSTRPAPAPQGPSGPAAIEWVRERRRAERALDRGER